MNRLLAVVSVLAFASGCASTTIIRSTPSGATVRNAAGEKVGKTPFNYRGPGTIGTTDVFYVEKPGFEEAAVTIKKDQVNGPALVGLSLGLLSTCWWSLGAGCIAFGVPMFWMADYQPVYSVELDKKVEEVPVVAPRVERNRDEDQDDAEQEEAPRKAPARTVSRR